MHETLGRGLMLVTVQIHIWMWTKTAFHTLKHAWISAICINCLCLSLPEILSQLWALRSRHKSHSPSQSVVVPDPSNWTVWVTSPPNWVRVRRRHRRWWEFRRTQWAFGPSAASLTPTRCNVRHCHCGLIVVNKSDSSSPCGINVKVVDSGLWSKFLNKNLWLHLSSRLFLFAAMK